MFDVAEKPLMEYICYYLNDKPSNIFLEDIKEHFETKELILHNIEEFENKILYFKLEVVPHDFYSDEMLEYRDNFYVKESVKFFNHSVREVYNSIVDFNLSEDAKKRMYEASIHFEFDFDTMTFCPKYVYSVRRNLLKIQEYIKSMIVFRDNHKNNNTWKSMDKEEKKRWKDTYNELSEVVKNINYNEDEANCKEKEVNELLETTNKLAIVLTIKDASSSQ